MKNTLFCSALLMFALSIWSCNVSVGIPVEDDCPKTGVEIQIEKLEELGVPFEVVNNTIVHPKEIVFEFGDNITDARKNAIRAALGVQPIDECDCGNIELWQASSHNDAIQILESLKGGNSEVDPDETNGYGFNNMIFGELKTPDPLYSNTFVGDQNFTGVIEDPKDDNGSNCSNPGDILIGNIDTGCDVSHVDLCGVIARNAVDQPNSLDDDDTDCIIDDYYGWNYIQSQYAPLDDHSHGTHIAGIIKKGIVNSSCNIGVLNYKTHAANGTSSIFKVTCAILEAEQDGCSVVNASWGHYGEPSDMLRNAIKRVGEKSNMIVVAASGNDGKNLVEDPQYPACFNLGNIITVGSSAQDGTESSFSNKSPFYVDILAPGENIISTMPGGGTGPKTGTSMATPNVAARVAVLFCTNGKNHPFTDIKKDIIK